MNISSIKNFSIKNSLISPSINSKKVTSPNLAPLTRDTVSFSGSSATIVLKQAKADLADAIASINQKAELNEPIVVADAEKIYNYFGIKTEKDEEGNLTLSGYGRPAKEFSFSDLGVNEDKLFEKVSRIKSNAYFCDSKITSLKNLKSIGGGADFRYSNVEDLGALESIGKYAKFTDSQITSLKNLKSIGGGADFRHSNVEDLGALESIGKDAYFMASQITSLKNLKSIGGSANFVHSNVEDLGALESIGEHAYFDDSKITSLKNLKSIGGVANFQDSKITDLGALESIGEYAYFDDSQITSLKNLKSISGIAYIDSNLKKENFANVAVVGIVTTQQ